ncbi:PKHD1 like 1, tandem duplicate 1 [Paramormyrops kingsleyae]|uniref:PKHD1 like 1, tandem duplicate 1 n=1 Tax=Paramormyrops kingsleyae TaxID=1676925 RepID=UPI003B96DD3D
MPNEGSLNGGTSLTIQGEGFAQETQFSLSSDSNDLGNNVQLVSDTRSFPCDVQKASSHSRLILCYTRAMPEDGYVVRVSVDGVPVPEENICYGDSRSYWCSFHARLSNTPTVNSLLSISGLPGTLITMEGNIFTDMYGTNWLRSSNGLNVWFLRSYMGGMPCELLKANSDLPFELRINWYTYGRMSCKMTGKYVGHHNLTFIISGEYGRSLGDRAVYSVSSLNKLAMFQTYAEVSGISPAVGSLEGGTVLTISGNFFDQTDYPATVLIAGMKCDIQSLFDHRITCKSPKFQQQNATIFPGGRGVKMEMWTNTSPARLEEALSYNENTSGYSTNWTDSLSYTWQQEIDYFVGRLSGFFVPTETDNYTFYIKGDDRTALYFSHTGNPQDKVKIAYTDFQTVSFFAFSTQKSDSIHLEAGKPYYVEALLQEYSWVASVDVGLFKEKSIFTSQQTAEAINEVQVIRATSDIVEERQVLTFENWTVAQPISEVQSVNISSRCFELDTCESTYYILIYNSEKTGKIPIAVSASAVEVQNALNSLWSIKPDMVQVVKVDDSERSIYHVTFNSKRGAFQSINYETPELDVSITVTELTKGKPSLETFTLQWGGILSRPINISAPESEVQSAVEAMLMADCAKKILPVENNEVAFFKDYEVPDSVNGIRVFDTEAFCGKYSLMNPDYLFLYYNTKNTGSPYGSVSLKRYSTVFKYLPLVSDSNAVTAMRRPPALARQGLFLQWVSVHKLQSMQTSHISYEITAAPFNCGHNVPLLAAEFLQVTNHSEDMAKFEDGNASVTVTRLSRASPPLSGTFDLEINGNRLQGLAVDVTAEDLRYAMQGVPAAGQLQVTHSGSCHSYDWQVEWRSNPGSQPLIQINSSSVKGVNPKVTAFVQTKGGLFKSRIMGDFLRVPEDRPQVQVLINRIPSKCSGDCGFEWLDSNTPKMTGISPSEGSYALGTIITISGSGFASENVTVLVGDVECSVLHLSSVMLTCKVGQASAGTHPVFLSFSSLGNAQHIGRNSFNFTNQMGVSSISPSSGSIEGGTLLTVLGFGFAEGIVVMIGTRSCTVVSVFLEQLMCITPPGAAGTLPVSLQMEGGTVLLNESFTYDETLIPLMTDLWPRTVNVTGHQILTILGVKFQDQGNHSRVLIGAEECRIIHWFSSNITCLLPQLPPALYSVQVQTESWGCAKASMKENATIEYVLKVTSIHPTQGSLYGGTRLTVTGSGFSSNISQNLVSLGDVRCEVISASEHNIECIVQSSEKTYTVTNKGIHPDYGIGYMWSPSSMTAQVGDTVVWRWEVPPFISGVGYRVFSVSSPSSTSYDGAGFTSGDIKTKSGFFSYRFTAPGTYYYSSGYVDVGMQRFMQGVVKVQSLQDRDSRLNLTVGGFEANYQPDYQLSNESTSERTSEPQCFQNVDLTSGFYFSFLACVSPSVSCIMPNNGTGDTIIHIEGSGFSNTSCANEVNIGDRTCHVINSTTTYINCQLGSESGLEVGIAHPVSVQVNNLGMAITSMIGEFGRRFVVLPVMKSVTPKAGGTTGQTRIIIWGSGFLAGLVPTVSVVGEPCTIFSMNYTTIICDTSSASALTGDVEVRVGPITASCLGDCQYEYSPQFVPRITGVSPSNISGNFTTITVMGAGFGDRVDDVVAYAGYTALEVLEVTDSNITLMVDSLPAGHHILRVVILTKGLAEGEVTLSSLAIATLSPVTGSTQGGTPLLITGNGFLEGNTSVTVGGSLCLPQSVRPNEVRCLTAANAEGSVQVRIQVLSVMYPTMTFKYSLNDTPIITAVNPATGHRGTAITIAGSGFGTDAQLVEVSIGGTRCSVTAINDTTVQCTVGAHAGGTFRIVFHHKIKGYASSLVDFSYEFLVNDVEPHAGGHGGGNILTVQGTGFDPDFSRVMVCGRECKVQRLRSTFTSLYCEIPESNSTALQQFCTVEVQNGNSSVKIVDAFSYNTSLTPFITTVSPHRGGTAGGTKLTITGSNFSMNISEVSVTIAGSVCDVESTNSTHIICITNAQPQSQKAMVRISIGNRGIAKTGNADFFYIDVWSSTYTWGGQSPPETGMFVVITKGQTILLDMTTPVLKMLLIQGGTLVFDEIDIELQAENILLTDGGVLQIGTEAAPFQHKAIITLHGHLRSQELPIYGSKTLGVRQGVLDLHGIPIPTTWTHLNETAPAGSSTLTLKQAVTWKAGDQIAIASTGDRHSQMENEMLTIASVLDNGRTLNLSQPLKYTHLGVSVTLPNGKVFEGRAEVGLLTRNIVIRGSNNIEWNDKIEACPDGFDIGEFATQTCFQGRFGEEIGSNQFGGCIMFHAPKPDQNLAIGRLEYVEVFHVGQAFQLGRSPIHWHLVGDVHQKSYIRGCSIHQAYNRAISIQNTHNLLVEHNVIYDIMGGGFFIEDGIETGNILQYNLAVFVKQSTSLLNDDITPAAYWVTNPNNIIRHNAAAGGTHFGFWYRMHDNPDTPSYNPSICPKRVPLGEFFNNTVHSQGWFGLWIFEEYYPTRYGMCYSSDPQPALFRSLTTWNCEKGAEWVNVGAVQFSDFMMVNNEVAGIECKRIMPWTIRGWGKDGGALVMNSTIVGHVDVLGLGSKYCTAQGITLPLDDGMSVMSTAFVNFDRPSCAAIAVAIVTGVCTDHCGGWSSRFSGIQFHTCPKKAAFKWEHEVALIDMDGSLTGSTGHTVVPHSALLDPDHCAVSVEWSAAYQASVCDETVRFHRLIITYPQPYSLWYKELILTNSFGKTSLTFLTYMVTHYWGWLAMLPDSETYNCYFKDADYITYISYGAMFYGFKEEDYIIINHNLTQIPDRFQIVDKRNASVLPLNFSRNVHGDWYFNETTKSLYYMVSGKGAPKWRSGSADPQVADIQVNFQVEHCFYKGCVAPSPGIPGSPGIPLPPGLDHQQSSKSNLILWSNETFWKSSPENNFKVPTDGDDVVIPSAIWMVMDIDIPSLNKILVLGVLEIPDTMNKTLNPGGQYRNLIINVTYISIQGGRLIAGWPDNPFKGELSIVLKGNHFTPEWPLPSDLNQGAKVIGVFGILDLYGKPHNMSRTKLASTAPAGTSTITLQDAVDWQAGDEIVISTTSYNPWHTEVRKILSISATGKILTLNQSLFYNHSGENFTVYETKQNYTLAGDVGLLSRNIKIIGEEYPGWAKESFGGRVLVGSFSSGGITYRGQAQIRNVEFYRSGQYGYPDPEDPRYSVAFLNLGEVAANESYIQGCSFHHGYSPAIGVFGTNGLGIDDNIIYFTVGEGIRVWGKHCRVRRNLVTMSVWPGTYQDRGEETNFNWNAAIEVNEGTHVVLQDNIVAGYERVAYRINGEPCPGTPNAVETWQQNEAHGGLYGVYMNKDGLPFCSLIQNFFVWRSFDYGIYVQASMTVLISNVTLVDNGMGVMSIIYSPPSVSHEYSNKKVLIQHALIVGSSPSLDCSEILPSTDANVQFSSEHRAPRPNNGGRSGICWPTFESDHNHAPEEPHHGITSYNAISGLMTVTDTVFVGFGSTCSKQTSVIFMTNPKNEDMQHPLQVKRVTVVDSTEDAKVFIHRPDVRMVNPAKCLDMDCDAKKKALLKDLDGSFLGAVGHVVPQSEFEWNGDKRRGLGDYRIPKVMLTYLNGSRIPVDQIAPYKGIIRDSSCTYMNAWQSYKCFGLNYEMLAIESLDADTETRRLSPVALLGDRYVDLLNGPQDHGWCSGYTCRRRVSLFHSIVATNKSFDVFFTSTSPQKLRLMLLNADNSRAVRVAIFYSKPQRLDVYVNKSLVAPTNAIWNSDKTDFTLKEPTFKGQFIPKLESDAAGSNFFESTYKMLNILVRGSTPVEIRTSPLLFISFQLPAMTEEEFFGDNLVKNLALFLKISPSMIRVTKVVREGQQRRRRATGLTAVVVISQPPVQQATNTTNEAQAYKDLMNIANNLGQASASGNLSKLIGINVGALGFIPPNPPPSDPTWAEVATQQVTREAPTALFVTRVDSLKVMVQPEAGEFNGPLLQQPSIMAIDVQGNCVSLGITSLMLTASLKNSSGSNIEGLMGNTTIPFDGCWANYTDLSISAEGIGLKMYFILNEVSTESRSFRVGTGTAAVTGTAALTGTASPSASQSSTFTGIPLMFSAFLFCINLFFSSVLLRV